MNMIEMKTKMKEQCLLVELPPRGRKPVSVVRPRTPQTPRIESGAGPAKGRCPIPPGKLLSVEELAVPRTSKNKVKARAIQSSFMTRKQQPSVTRWSRGGGSLRSSCARFTPVRRFASTGRGGVRRVGGWNILPPAPVAAKKTSADGGGIGVSSQGETLEEAAVGTVGERGGRPGPHPKPNKGWGPSGACMRRVPLGLVGCLGRSRGKTKGGAGGR